MDLARAPRRTARKKGSGYENGHDAVLKQKHVANQPRTQDLSLVAN